MFSQFNIPPRTRIPEILFISVSLSLFMSVTILRSNFRQKFWTINLNLDIENDPGPHAGPVSHKSVLRWWWRTIKFAHFETDTILLVPFFCKRKFLSVSFSLFANNVFLWYIQNVLLKNVLLIILIIPFPKLSIYFYFSVKIILFIRYLPTQFLIVIATYLLNYQLH